MQIKLLLLDFDGTLVDTRRANGLAYIEALREAGYTLTEAEYNARYFGMRCYEFMADFGIADPAEREQIRRRKVALYPTFFDTVRLNRPLWEFCIAFRAQGGQVWIVSTGGRDNIENVMRHLQAQGEVSGALAEETDGIIAGADIARSKPEPDAFLEAMRRAGCTPAETLIFEDSEYGLEAARRSGAAYVKIVL